MSTKNTCENCFFWNPNTHYHMGQCRLRGPIAPNFQDINIKAVWPETWSYDWCGEFKEKEPRVGQARGKETNPNP